MYPISVNYTDIDNNGSQRIAVIIGILTSTVALILFIAIQNPVSQSQNLRNSLPQLSQFETPSWAAGIIGSGLRSPSVISSSASALSSGQVTLPSVNKPQVQVSYGAPAQATLPSFNKPQVQNSYGVPALENSFKKPKPVAAAQSLGTSYWPTGEYPTASQSPPFQASTLENSFKKPKPVAAAQSPGTSYWPTGEYPTASQSPPFQASSWSVNGQSVSLPQQQFPTEGFIPPMIPPNLASNSAPKTVVTNAIFPAAQPPTTAQPPAAVLPSSTGAYSAGSHTQFSANTPISVQSEKLSPVKTSEKVDAKLSKDDHKEKSNDLKSEEKHSKDDNKEKSKEKNDHKSVSKEKARKENSRDNDHKSVSKDKAREKSSRDKHF